MADRTVYVGNLSSQITEDVVRSFFASCCGPINQVRLAGDPSYATRFGFIEFQLAEGAQQACSISGTQLDGRKLRITMSKTPITPPNPLMVLALRWRDAGGCHGSSPV